MKRTLVLKKTNITTKQILQYSLARNNSLNRQTDTHIHKKITITFRLHAQANKAFKLF